MHKLAQWLFLVAAALAVALQSGGLAQSPVSPERIVAIGDLHGDFEAWDETAQAAGLIDEDGIWRGGETVLVQLGDLTDRGPDSLKIIRHLQRLTQQADKAGGQVIVLLGNHEAMNVTGDLRYVHPGEYEAFRDRNSKRRRDATWRANREQIEAAYAALEPPFEAKDAKKRWYAQTPLGMLEHRKAWKPGGELAEWAATLPAVVKVGDTLFVHGGLSIERGLRQIGDINAAIRSALAADQTTDQSALDDPLGPLWYRGNVMRSEAEVPRAALPEELAQVLAWHGAARMVVGHTPSLEGIATSENGRVIRVDTGSSSFYGGPRSYLEIRGKKLVAHQRLAGEEWTSRLLTPQTEGEHP